MLEVCVVGFAYFELAVPRTAPMPASGTEIFVDALSVRLGGALNTASVVRALGHRAGLASPRGAGPTDLAVQETLQRLDIDDHFWPSRNDPAISLVYYTTTDRAFLSSADTDALSACPPLPAARWIHVPGLIEAERLAPRLAQARRQGSLVSVSGSWAPEQLERLSQEQSRKWDLLILNDAEANVVAPDLAQALEKLQRVSANVVITAGAQGALGVLGGVRADVDAEPAEAVDFTGAGDAFCGGLLAGLVRGLAAQESLRLGAKVAARILTQHGGVASPELLQEFAK